MSDAGKIFWQACHSDQGFYVRALRCTKHCGSWRYWRDPESGTRFKSNGNPFNRSKILAMANALIDEIYDLLAED